MAVEVTFWGVRGSFPCATPNHIVYGGNTSCVSVEAGDQFFILDAGTGIWQLGKHILKRGIKAATLLMSHTHTDHIVGFPFFAPAWVGQFHLDVMAGHLADNGGIASIFAHAMRDPVFPVQLDQMGGKISFADFRSGETLKFGDITVRTAPLNHPNGATGYRIEHGGASVCYITDTEHKPGTLDQTIVDLCRGADAMIYDATYTDEMFHTKIGWGHSTWQEALRVAAAAGVKTPVIFHHEPDHTDDIMAGIEEQVRAANPQAVVAREGMKLSL